MRIKEELNKNYVVLSGKSLNLIKKDPYLKLHTAFICAMAGKVIAYNLTPNHKKFLVKLV